MSVNHLSPFDLLFLLQSFGFISISRCFEVVCLVFALRGYIIRNINSAQEDCLLANFIVKMMLKGSLSPFLFIFAYFDILNIYYIY